MAKLPYMQFYPADYLVDTMPLTPAARGIWMDMLCMMWRAPSRGSMTHPLEGWCRVLRCDKATFELCLWEFRQFDVCETVTNGNGNVTVRCRRMFREEKARKTSLLRVRKYRSNAACNAPVQECNRDISESESESDIRIRKELKKKRSPFPPLQGGTPAKGKTSFPDSWKPTAEELAQWRLHGIADPSVEFATFRDHAKANDRRCKDWAAAWRNWCRKTLRMKEERHGLSQVR